VETNYN